MINFVAIIALTLVTACSVFGGKAAEEPGYEVVLKDGAIEIRQYEPYVIAVTSVDADYEESTKEAFGRLFDYITGDNEGEAEITMTAPVIQEPVKIKMTSPVIQQKSEAGWKMAFVLPEEYTRDTAPKPTNPDIEIKQVYKNKVAVITYSGSLNEENIQDNLAKLRNWLKENKYIYNSDYKSAGYNPPWTIPYFRRNEVIIDIASHSMPRDRF